MDGVDDGLEHGFELKPGFVGVGCEVVAHELGESGVGEVAVVDFLKPDELLPADEFHALSHRVGYLDSAVKHRGDNVAAAVGFAVRANEADVDGVIGVGLNGGLAHNLDGYGQLASCHSPRLVNIVEGKRHGGGLAVREAVLCLGVGVVPGLIHSGIERYFDGGVVGLFNINERAVKEPVYLVRVRHFAVDAVDSDAVLNKVTDFTRSRHRGHGGNGNGILLEQDFDGYIRSYLTKRITIILQVDRLIADIGSVKDESILRHKGNSYIFIVVFYRIDIYNAVRPYICALEFSRAVNDLNIYIVGYLLRLYDRAVEVGREGVGLAGDVAGEVLTRQVGLVGVGAAVIAGAIDSPVGEGGVSVGRGHALEAERDVGHDLAVLVDLEIEGVKARGNGAVPVRGHVLHEHLPVVGDAIPVGIYIPQGFISNIVSYGLRDLGIPATKDVAFTSGLLAFTVCRRIDTFQQVLMNLILEDFLVVYAIGISDGVLELLVIRLIVAVLVFCPDGIERGVLINTEITSNNPSSILLRLRFNDISRLCFAEANESGQILLKARSICNVDQVMFNIRGRLR